MSNDALPTLAHTGIAKTDAVVLAAVLAGHLKLMYANLPYWCVPSRAYAV